MREKTYLVVFLLLAGGLLYLGHDLIRGSVLFAWLLTFAGTATAGIMMVVLYRIRFELRANRMELARRQAELDFALKVQRALFPHVLPQSGDLEFAAICIPAAGISGDYYDVLQLENGRLAFAITDISGKGISAAILMANVQALLRALAAMASGPAEICSRLNRHLHQVTDAARYATLFYAEWDRGTRRLRYINAGHNPPVLMRGASVRWLVDGGIPLGVLPDSEYQMGEVELEPGDLLALYSDGITEAGLRNGNEFGEKRLVELLVARRDRSLAEIQSQVLQVVRDWAGAEQDDDMTLMLVRAQAPADSRAGRQGNGWSSKEES